MSEKESKNLPSLQDMDFEAKQNILGVFGLLLRIDKRINPKNYEDNRSADNPDKTK